MTTPQTPAERPLPASSRCRGNGDQEWLACPRKADSPELQALKQEKEALLRVGGGQTQLDLNPVDQGRREGESESLTGARPESPVGPGAGAVGLRWPERLCPARGVCAHASGGGGCEAAVPGAARVGGRLRAPLPPARVSPATAASVWGSAPPPPHPDCGCEASGTASSSGDRILPQQRVGAACEPFPHLSPWSRGVGVRAAVGGCVRVCRCVCRRSVWRGAPWRTGGPPVGSALTRTMRGPGGASCCLDRPEGPRCPASHASPVLSGAGKLGWVRTAGPQPPPW